MGCSREICKICHRVNRVGFWVPPSVWIAVVPKEFSGCVVCLDCFTSLADERVVQWSDDIEFYPVSFVTFIETRYAEVTNKINKETPGDIEEFKPSVFFQRDHDCIEYIMEDVASVTVRIDNRLDLLYAMDDRSKLVGARINGVIAEFEAPSPSVEAGGPDMERGG